MSQDASASTPALDDASDRKPSKGQKKKAAAKRAKLAQNDQKSKEEQDRGLWLVEESSKKARRAALDDAAAKIHRFFQRHPPYSNPFPVSREDPDSNLPFQQQAVNYRLRHFRLAYWARARHVSISLLLRAVPMLRVDDDMPIYMGIASWRLNWALETKRNIIAFRKRVELSKLRLFPNDLHYPFPENTDPRLRQHWKYAFTNQAWAFGVVGVWYPVLRELWWRRDWVGMCALRDLCARIRAVWELFVGDIARVEDHVFDVNAPKVVYRLDWSVRRAKEMAPSSSQHEQARPLMEVGDVVYVPDGPDPWAIETSSTTTPTLTSTSSVHTESDMRVSDRQDTGWEAPSIQDFVHFYMSGHAFDYCETSSTKSDDGCLTPDNIRAIPTLRMVEQPKQQYVLPGTSFACYSFEDYPHSKGQSVPMVGRFKLSTTRQRSILVPSGSCRAPANLETWERFPVPKRPSLDPDMNLKPESPDKDKHATMLDGIGMAYVGERSLFAHGLREGISLEDLRKIVVGRFESEYLGKVASSGSKGWSGDGMIPLVLVRSGPSQADLYVPRSLSELAAYLDE